MVKHILVKIDQFGYSNCMQSDTSTEKPALKNHHCSEAKKHNEHELRI